jgi:hypothetical protein
MKGITGRSGTLNFPSLKWVIRDSWFIEVALSDGMMVPPPAGAALQPSVSPSR